MFLGYGNFIIRAVCTKSFDGIPILNEQKYKQDDVESNESNMNQSNRTDALLS